MTHSNRSSNVTPGSNENRAKHDGSGDAIEQCRVLAFLADLESLKQDEKDEEIVDAEGGLDGKTGYKFKGRLASLSQRDPAGKAHCNEDKKAGPQPCD